MPPYLHVVENPAERGPMGTYSQDRAYRDPRTMSGKVSTYTSGSRYDQPDGSPSATGRRIGDIRAAERSQEMRAVYRHYIMRIIAVLAIAIAIVVAGFAIYWSPLFTITEIEVTGNNYLSSEQVIEMAAVGDGNTLLRVDKGDIESRLLESPWVESVNVKRSVPHTLTIEVTERSIDATVDIPVTTQSDTTSTWAIASDGTWLDQLRPDSTEAYDQKVVADSAAVPHISDVGITSVPTAGATCDDAGVNNVLTILSTVSDEFRSQIVSATAPTPARTTFTLSNGVKVAFGTADNIQAKERVVLQLLAEHSGAISYINVRVVDRPAWRGLEEDSADAGAAQSVDEYGTDTTSDTTDDTSADTTGDTSADTSTDTSTDTSADTSADSEGDTTGDATGDAAA